MKASKLNMKTSIFSSHIRRIKKAMIPREMFFDFYGLSLIPEGFDEYTDKYRNLIYQEIKNEYLTYLESAIRGEARHYNRDWGESSPETASMQELADKFREGEELLTDTEVAMWNEANPEELARKGSPQTAWDSNFGGETWEQIANAFTQLQNATSLNDIMVAIDHIHDLEHNTESVFNKDPEYTSGFIGDLDIKATATSQELLSYLSSDVRKLLQNYLAVHGESQVTDLTSKPEYSPAEMTRLAEDPNTPLEILEQIVVNRSVRRPARLQILKNPNLSPEVLAQLAMDKERRIREEVALHPNTPPEALAQLAVDEEYWVKWNVTENPNTPPEIVEQLQSIVASKLNMKKYTIKDQQKFIDQLRNSRDPDIATKGYGYFIAWADGRAKVAYKHKQDAIDFIGQGTTDIGKVNDKDYPNIPLDVVKVKYREVEKGERVRNKFTEASAKTYQLMKKALDESTGIPPMVPVSEDVLGELGQTREEYEQDLQYYIQHPEELDTFYERAREDREFNPQIMIDPKDILQIYELEYKVYLAKQYNDVEKIAIMESELTGLLQNALEKMLGPKSPQDEKNIKDSGDIIQMMKLFHQLLNKLHDSGHMAEHYIGGGNTAAWLTYLSENKELPKIWERQYLYSSRLNLRKKAWDNPPRDDATYPGSNVSGPVPHSTPKSPGSKPRRDQRTKDDYHAPSQLDRDPIPGDTQPEQGTGGQPHSGDLEKVDNIYPEPSNWLRPLKGLPFTDEHLMHDFNEDFDTEYYIRQRGLNMRRVKKALNMKKAQEVPKWTDPKFLGSDIYDFIKLALQKYQAQIQEDPMFKGKLIDEIIPYYIERNQDPFISAGITLPIMLEAIKEAANLLMIDDNTTLDTLAAERKAAEIYPDPRQQTSEISQMQSNEAKLLEELTADQIWDIVRSPETANTPEGQAARGLIEKGIIASRLNMRKQSNNFTDEIANQVIIKWQQTAEAVGADVVLERFKDRTEAYNMIMSDLRGEGHPENIANMVAIQVIDTIPQILQTWGNKLNLKKRAEVNPKYDYGTVQTSDVSETLIDAIKDIQDNIDKDKLYDGEDEPGWVEHGLQKLFHITILFGVNDNVKDEVKKVFDKYKPVHIETTGIKYFSSDPNYDVVIVRCKSEELTKIHNELKDTLENQETYPNYKPHITIAYLKKGEKLDDSAQITDISWEIDSLDISTADGKLEKVSALAVPIRKSLDYFHSWRKKKKKKKEVVSPKEKKILQMDSNKLKGKASILDEPRASLDEAIWDIGEDDLPVLKPDIKIHIVENFLSYISKFGGYIKPEEFVKNMFYTGSTATYTYTDVSDIDIHIIVDWIDLATLNPDKAKEDPKEMWQELHDIFWWTLNKIKLPGTKHPLTYYVVPPGEEKEKILDVKEEIYDIGHDVWLIPPGEVIGLPQEAMMVATEEAAEIMSRIEEHLANARKGIMDYDMLKILEKLNNGNTPIILQKFDETLKTLDDELVALKDEYALLKQKRQEGFELGKPIAPTESKNYTKGNIIFKLVERYKLMEVLREIKRITDAKPVEHGQVDDLADALGFEDE